MLIASRPPFRCLVLNLRSKNLHALHCFMHLIEDLLSQIYQEWCSEGPSAFNASISVDSSSVLINQRLIHL